MKISKKLVIAAKLTVTLFLILLLFKRVNITEVLDIIKRVNPDYLILASFFYLLIIVLQAYRWQSLLRVHGIKITLGKLIRLTFIGYFFNNFLPTTVGGDVIKGYLAGKETKKTAESYISVLMDRVMGIAGLVFLALVVAFFIPVLGSNRSIMYVIWFSFIILTVLAVLAVLSSKYWTAKFGFLKSLFQKLKIENKVEKVYDAFKVYKEHKGVLMKTVLLSLSAHTCFIAINYFIVKGLPLSQKVRLVYFFVYTPAIALISSLPVTINGIGVRENLYIEFFSQLLGKDTAGSLSIIFLFFLLGAGLLGGIFYLLSGFRIASVGAAVKKERRQL